MIRLLRGVLRIEAGEMSFGDRLRTVRRLRGLTQAQLAARCGIGQQVISRYERGDREPEWPNLVKLKTALDTTLDYLFGLADDPNAPFILSSQERDWILARRAEGRVDATDADLDALREWQSQAKDE